MTLSTRLALVGAIVGAALLVAGPAVSWCGCA
jgi:phosphate/sulfate permease